LFRTHQGVQVVYPESESTVSVVRLKSRMVFIPCNSSSRVLHLLSNHAPYDERVFFCLACFHFS
jgi:hypothetical protein